MAKEVGSRELAAAGGVASNKALDELLKKKALLAEADQAKAEQHEGEQAATGEQAVTEEGQVASAEGSVFAEGQAYDVASAGAVAADGGSSSSLPTNTLLIAGGAALVGGAALALSSDDDGDTKVEVENPGGSNNNPDPDPTKNNAPNVKVGDSAINTNAVVEISENNTVAAAISIADPEGDSVTTTLTGADAALFEIVNGALVFKAAPNFEAPADSDKNNTYQVTINSKDAPGLTTSVNVTVVVKNVSNVPGEESSTPGATTDGDDSYQLTDNIAPDNVNLGKGNDKFDASVGDLNNQDQINGGEGDDVLNVVMSGGEDEKPTITSVETINIESLGATANNLNLDNVNGTTVINVIDQGDNSGDLNIKSLVNDTTLVNLTGDQTITLSVRDSAPVDNKVKTGVDAFEGTLALGNAIEALSIAATGDDSAFDLKDLGGALKTVTVTGDANVELTTFASTKYDFSAATGDNTLIFANPAKLAAEVIFGVGDDVVDFGAFLEAKGTPADKVNGGAGFDTFVADLAEVDVEPIITNTELISLSFLGKGNFDASGVTNAADGTDYEVRKSSGYVNINDITNGSNIDIVGDVKNGFLGSTFDFKTGSNATTTITFVTASKEATFITHTGDVEVDDVADLTVAVDGQGEVELDGAIALDNDNTTSLTITTNSEDDDDIDNDGDLTVYGDNEGEEGTGITQSAALQNLTIKAINGNIFIADGEVTEGETAIDDASSLVNLDLLADNATLALGDIGVDDDEGEADQLDSVSIVGANRGIFNLDDIVAGTLIETSDAEDDFSFTTDSSAYIEEFKVVTAERSETKNTFTEDSTPFGYNDIDDIIARVIEDFEITVAKDGRLEIGDVYSSIDNLTINGAGRLDLFNNDTNTEAGALTILADEQGEEDGFFFYNNTALAQFYVNEVNATAHTGPIELNFQTFTGADGEATENGGFDNAEYVEATVVLGNQNTIDQGIRFDSYGLVGITSGFEIAEDATVTVVAGNGNHTDGGAALYALNLGNDYGIITGFADDSVTTGSGSSYIFTGFGDDVISAGGGADIVRGGYGQDIIDLGVGDKAADVVQFVGGYLEDVEGDTFNGDVGETLGDNYDRVIGFEAGAGGDIAQLWNFGLDQLLGGAVPFDGIVAVRQENIGDQDSVIDLLPDYVDGGLSEIVEFVGLPLNLDLKTTFDNELIEEDFAQNFVGDILIDVSLLDDGTSGFFAIVYDAEGDDAALFLIDSLSPSNIDGIFRLDADDVQLVAVFEGVSSGAFQTGDFVFGQAASPINLP